MTTLDRDARGIRRLLRWLEAIDPYWDAQLVAAAAIALDLVLSERLTLGPRWLLPSLEGAMLLGMSGASTHPLVRHSRIRRRLAMALIALVSAVNVFSLVELCVYLVNGGSAGGHALIGSGMLLWVTNVLLFGLWFWQLDGGGPAERQRHPDSPPDFLFVQMMNKEFAPAGWRPQLIDYLYTSFTNATAFSPTDTMPLSPWAKSLMAVQSTTSLVTVGLVVARAVNIL